MSIFNMFAGLGSSQVSDEDSNHEDDVSISAEGAEAMEEDQTTTKILSKFTPQQLEIMEAQAVITMQMFRREFANPMDKRMEKIEAQQESLEKKTTNLESAQADDALVRIEQGQKIAALEKKSEDTVKRCAAIEDETRKVKDNVVDLSTRQTDNEKDTAEHKSALKQLQETVEQQGKQIQSLEAQAGQIPLIPEQKPRVFNEFQKLVRTAVKMGDSYTVGQKPPSVLNENSEEFKAEKKLRDKVQNNIQSLGGFLDGLEIPAAWNLYPVQQNPNIFKLVPGDNFSQVLPELREILNRHGWWISKSAPNTFRRMEGRTRKFLADLKSTKSSLKAIWFELKGGYVTYMGRPLLPFFLIPEDESSWAKLFDLFEEHLKSTITTSWVEQFRAVTVVDGRDFIKKFADAGGLSELL